MIELIDSHCHLNYDYAPKSADDLVREAGENGVSRMITVGVDVVGIPALEKLSETYANIHHTVGMHPHDTIDLTDEGLATIERATKHPKCVAVGEIGLDYHYDHSPREIQRKRLDQQLEIALRAKKPVVIHARDAEADLLESLRAFAAKVEGRIPGVIHCFTGTYPFGAACIDLGFYISFSGILTFKTAEDLRSSARAFPLDRLLVETDSPYLAPIPHRGRKCEPSMVRQTAMKLAETKGLTLEELAAATVANTQRVFGI